MQLREFTAIAAAFLSISVTLLPSSALPVGQRVESAISAQAFKPLPTPKRVVIPATPQNLALVEAVIKRDYNAVQRLLAEGASADTMTGWDSDASRFPVALLATVTPIDGKSDNNRMFDLLIAHIHDPNATNTDGGETLLMMAAELNDASAVKRLLAMGARVNDKTSGLSIHTALTAAIQFGAATVHTVTPTVAMLLEHGADVNDTDKDGITPLMLAAMFGRLDEVKLLIAHGADPAKRTKNSFTALRFAGIRHYPAIEEYLRGLSPMTLCEAAQYGDIARMKASLAAGDGVNAPDNRSLTPLHYVAGSGSVKAAEFLLQNGADVHAEDKAGRTPLHIAALSGDTAMISCLLVHGATINAFINDRAGVTTPTTPLIEAVEQAHPEAVALLLSKGVDLKLRGQGQAALERAVALAGQMPRRTTISRSEQLPKGDAFLDARQKVIELLLAGGVDTRTDARNALVTAAYDHQSGLVEWLIKRGAPVNARGIGPSGTGETTPLIATVDAWGGAIDEERMTVAGEESGPELKDLRTEENHARQTVEMLIKLGADVNLPDADGQTPLIDCCSNHMVKPALLLLDRGARIDATDARGRTAIMHAAAAGDEEMTALLLKHGASVHGQDNAGMTVLMLAVDDGANGEARNEEKEMVTMGVRPGGEEPGRAQELPNPDGHPAVVRLLLQHGADVNAVAKDGSTAMSRARAEHFTEVAAILTAAGAQ